MGYSSRPLTDKQQQICEQARRWAEAADQVGPEYADWIARHRELCGQAETLLPKLSSCPPFRPNPAIMRTVWR